MIRSVLLLAFLSDAGVYAADSLYVCPTEIAAAWNVPSAPEGWETFGSNTVVRHRLRGATFTDGHPKGQAFLKPYMTDTSPRVNERVRRDLYQFSAKYPDGIWLVCGYQNTPAIVFKRLPDTPKSCEVSYPAKAANTLVQAIRCR